MIKEILKAVPEIGYSISFTTRKMREGEKHGRDYFFVSQEEFKGLIKEGEFLEFAEVHGNFYGTSIKQVESELEIGRDVILEIDVQGATCSGKNAERRQHIYFAAIFSNSTAAFNKSRDGKPERSAASLK